ncbi:MAG: c-type cytochrome, partial [Candidatus Accumulibacter sp.]|uniref:c-type cytochrome n=1 Tax=Accumulibacter sp. TaxID=2053492 RepID=UPI002879DA4B
MKKLTLITSTLLVLTATSGALADGKDVYTKVCAVCHAGGIAAAPRLGNAADWGPRIAGGMPKLYQSALKGTPKGMPAKGGNLTLPDADVKAAVDYMVAAAGGAKPTADAKAESKPEAKKETKAEAKAEAKTEAKKETKAEARKEESPKAAAPAAGAPTAAAAAPAPAFGPQGVVAAAGASAEDVNTFNRLLKPPSKRNLPPAEDGIHDPTNDG